MDIIAAVFQIVGSLGLFLFGMKLMSDGLQNSAGERMQKLVGYMTINRFSAFFTGLGITSIIQSSSATTVFVVSFVNAGLLTLTQAIGVIMGASIGTTVTAWIISLSLSKFEFDIAGLAIPVIAIGLPFIFMKAKSRRDLGETFIGFGILFLGLLYLRNSVPDIRSHSEVLQFITHFAGLGFVSNITFVVIGTLVTVIVQSSSAAMAITLTMAFAGWMDFSTAAALCLGENIGTTITAQLAALGQSRTARRAAMAHTLFNVIGVIWMLSFFNQFLRMIDYIVPGSIAEARNIPVHLAMFHTMFNVANSAIFIWLVPQYARLIEKMVPARPEDMDGVYKLRYVSAPLQDTPEINILTAKAEIVKMADRVRDMYDRLFARLKDGGDIGADLLESLTQEERYLDQMQEEVSRFVADCMQVNPSEASVSNMSHMLRMVDELESISDSCHVIGKLLEKKRSKQVAFTKDMHKEIEPFITEVRRFLQFIRNNINRPMADSEFSEAHEMEKTINSFRNTLKKASRKRIQNGSNVRMEIMYIDILQQLEHMGDYALNIARELKEMV